MKTDFELGLSVAVLLAVFVVVVWCAAMFIAWEYIPWNPYVLRGAIALCLAVGFIAFLRPES